MGNVCVRLLDFNMYIFIDTSVYCIYLNSSIPVTCRTGNILTNDKLQASTNNNILSLAFPSAPLNNLHVHLFQDSLPVLIFQDGSSD